MLARFLGGIAGRWVLGRAATAAACVVSADVRLLLPPPLLLLSQCCRMKMLGAERVRPSSCWLVMASVLTASCRLQIGI
jgi:hypothetical protein